MIQYEYKKVPKRKIEKMQSKGWEVEGGISFRGYVTMKRPK